jgi:hypothetical protein
MHGADFEAAHEQCDYYLHNGTLCIEFDNINNVCSLSSLASSSWIKSSHM